MKRVLPRRRIGCREMKSKKEMIRVIKTAEDEIMSDATGHKNGRGACPCPSMECLRKTVKEKGPKRSFRMIIPKGVYETLEEEMEELDR